MLSDKHFLLFLKRKRRKRKAIRYLMHIHQRCQKRDAFLKLAWMLSIRQYKLEIKYKYFIHLKYYARRRGWRQIKRRFLKYTNASPPFSIKQWFIT